MFVVNGDISRIVEGERKCFIRYGGIVILIIVVYYLFIWIMNNWFRFSLF